MTFQKWILELNVTSQKKLSTQDKIANSKLFSYQLNFPSNFEWNSKEMSFLSNLQRSRLEILVTLSCSKQNGRSPRLSILFKSVSQAKKCWASVVLHQNPVWLLCNSSFKLGDFGVFWKSSFSKMVGLASDLVRQWNQLSLAISSLNEHSWFWNGWFFKVGHMEK